MNATTRLHTIPAQPTHHISTLVTIINSKTLQIIYEVPPNDNDKGEIYGPVRACRFCPNGKVLAKGHDTGIIEVRCKKT